MAAEPSSSSVLPRRTKHRDHPGFEELPPGVQEFFKERLELEYEISVFREQRIFGPSSEWVGEHPIFGSDVFIRHIPPDLYEDELVPFLESAGNVFQVRLLLKNSGQARGFAYVTYSNPDVAINAIRILNKVPIRPHKYLHLTKSRDSHALIVSRIPKDKCKSEVFESFSKWMSGVHDITMSNSTMEPGKNAGFVFVQFKSHRYAAIAREFIQNEATFWGMRLAAQWAVPEREACPKENENSRIRCNYPILSNVIYGNNGGISKNVLSTIFEWP
ncbi:APOBEC1 complementation factor [Gryllus bimaculatus]|nr:APOBEC1 complementation factor [Gryllus bimaculatus]